MKHNWLKSKAKRAYICVPHQYCHESCVKKARADAECDGCGVGVTWRLLMRLSWTLPDGMNDALDMLVGDGLAEVMRK